MTTCFQLRSKALILSGSLLFFFHGVSLFGQNFPRKPTQIPIPFLEKLNGGLPVQRIARHGNSVEMEWSEGSVTLHVLPSIIDAKKVAGEIALSPELPEPLIPSIGDASGKWLSSDGSGSILFSRGTVVAVVWGKKWELAHSVASSLDKTILEIGPTEMLTQINLLRDREAPDEVLPAIVNKALPELIKQLDTAKSSEERLKTIIAIMDVGDRTAVPVLLTQLDPKYPFSVRGHAIKALGRLGDASAIPVLVAILEHPIKGEVKDENGSGREPIERRLAVVALGEIGAASALPLLENISKSEAEYPSVKESAGVAIRRVVENR